jgi:hypothetical protein
VDSTFTDAARALQERLDAPEPETWRPDDPASGHNRLLIGELVAVQDGRTVWGEKQIAVLRDGEGRLWNVWLLNKVLVEEFSRQQPKIGEMLAVSYDGVVHRENASDYEKYRLMIHRPGQPVAWHTADGDPEPAPPAAAAAQAAPQPAPAQPSLDEQTAICDECGFANGRHAAGCSSDIPF